MGFAPSKSAASEAAAEEAEAKANALKAACNYPEAAKAYAKAADLSERAGDATAATASLLSAVGCYQQAETWPEAAAALERACGYLAAAGRFSQVARQQRRLAEIWERTGQQQAAIDCYLAGAQTYLGEDSKALAVELLGKAVRLQCLAGAWSEGLQQQRRICSIIGSWDHPRYALKEGLCLAAVMAVGLGEEAADAIAEPELQQLFEARNEAAFEEAMATVSSRLVRLEGEENDWKVACFHLVRTRLLGSSTTEQDVAEAYDEEDLL